MNHIKMCENCCSIYSSTSCKNCKSMLTFQEMVTENNELKQKIIILEKELMENNDLTRENSILHSIIFNGIYKIK